MHNGKGGGVNVIPMGIELSKPFMIGKVAQDPGYRPYHTVGFLILSALLVPHFLLPDQIQI
jgi:hypothetical protein